MVDVHVVQGLLTTPYILRTHGKGKVVGEKESLSGVNNAFRLPSMRPTQLFKGHNIQFMIRCAAVVDAMESFD